MKGQGWSREDMRPEEWKEPEGEMPVGCSL